MIVILRVACLLSFLVTACQAGVLLGCYKESLRSRHFNVNPGDYSPEVMTIGLCKAKCGGYKYSIAALSSGKFCFCGNSLPDPLLNEASGNCDQPCAGDSGQNCGGLNHVSVYNSGERITGLAITTDAASNVVETGTEVAIGLSVDSGKDIIYSMDYGDGAGRTSPNVSGILTRAYNAPGEYHMLVYANDMNGTFEEQVASVAVRVDSPPGEVEVECDDPLATHEPGVCSVTVWSGSALTCDVTVAYTAPISYTLPIEDPPLSFAGPPIPSKETEAGSDTPENYLSVASEFSQSGKILAWEFYAHTIGVITLMILKPGCNDYCYSSNTCTGSCDSATQIVTTCSSPAFCMQYATCSDACNPLSRYNSHAATYEVSSSVTINVATTGYQYLPEVTEVLVEPGYILGLSHNTGEAQLGRITASSPEAERSFAYSNPTIGDTFSVGAGSARSFRHAIRAIASGGSKIHLPFTFETAGNYTLTATASSKNLGPPTLSATGSTVIRVLEGINATILIGPDFGITGQNVEFIIEPHSGNDVLYNWTFGSDEYLMTPQSQKAHAFPSLGTYLINVTSYNSISSKYNFTTVTIEDEVSGLSFSAPHTILNTPTVFSYTLTQGSNYTCEWDYGDGSAKATTDELTTPLGSGTNQYTYSSIGEYTASVNCSNDVSYATDSYTFKVQEEITNLRLLKEGEDKDTDFEIMVVLDSGSEVTVTLVFDGSPLQVNQDSTYQWNSGLQAGRGAATIPVEVTAENLVSNLSISLDFIILSKIVDPDLYVGFENVSSHTNVDFIVQVASGSDVRVDIDFKDGSIDSYTQPLGGEWLGTYTFTHSFTMGGRFQVTATFSNAEGSYPVTREVLVLVSVNSINCVMEKYALYHPPAEVSLILEGTTMPTEPTLTLDWEGALYDPIQRPLVLNTPYNHTFGDTGVYTVTATLTNLLGNKSCVKELIVVEKLYDPQFDMPFPKAAIGLPFEVKFCLFRGPSGDLCNLTYDYGAGGTPAGPDTFERQGKDKLGCDSHFVTYADGTPRTIKVTATTPLESTNATYDVELINGATDDELEIIPDSNEDFELKKTFTIKYKGPKTSVTTSISVAFGDGEVDSHSYIFGTGNPTTIVEHQFTIDGLLIATFTIENDAFRVVKNVSVGVYKSFSNPTASIYYIAEKPPGTRLYGYDNANTLFPMGKDIWFAVADDNNAYADTYILTITKDGGTPVTETYSTSEVNYTLTAPGNYKVVVTLSNPRNNVNTPEYSLQTFQLIEGLSVNETQLKVQTDEPKIFEVSFTSTGSQTCIYVDYNSGEARRQIYTDLSSTDCKETGYDTATRFSLSNVARLQETYAVDGYYELKVRAVNPFSDMETTIGFSITGLDCTKPSVDISNRHPYFNDAEEFLRSDHIRIRGLSTIDCGQSYDNIKSWKIENYNESFDTLVEEIDISSLVGGKAELNIPPRFLKLGLYRITYTMTMQGDYGSNSFQASTFTYVKISASPLVGIMVQGGNSRIRRGQGQTLTLDPKLLSLDPDVDSQIDQGISVSAWECSLVGGSADSGCDVFIPGEEKQVLDISKMNLAEYEIKATLEKGGRTAETMIVLEVTSGSPPIVVIQQSEGSVVFQESDGYKVLKSSPLPLECICSSCSTVDDPHYNWKISLEDYRWPNGWRLLNEQETADRVIAIDGKNSKVISIGAELFEDFDSSLMQAECEITVGSDTGSVSTTLKVNSPPADGNCTVSPYNRTFTSDEVWTIRVNGWTDEDGIAEYQFFIHTSDDETERQITSFIPQGDEFTLAVSLTEGYAYNDYEEEIFVKVRDFFGAITKFSCGRVVVRPIDLNTVQDFYEDILTEELNEINRLFAEADQASCSQKSISLFSSLNSAKYAGYRMASSFANSRYGQIDIDRPSYQQINELMNDPEESFSMETDRNTRAKVREDILEKLNELETQSVIAIQQVSSCFAEALISSDEIVQETQNSVMDSLIAMHDYMSNTSNLENVPPQDIEVFLENGVSTVGGIMDASGSNGYFGTLDELADAQEDEEFLVYDSSITAGDDIEMEQASTMDEALALQKARVHKKRQAHTAMVVREKTTKALDKTAQIFNYLSVPSQELEIKTVKMKMKMKKSNEENLKGETIQLANSDGGITLPNVSFLADAQESVVVSVSQSTNYPIRYTDFAEKRISNSTNFITVNLYDKNNAKMSISDTSEPFKITIPRDANMEKPSYISIDPIISPWTNLMSFVTTINYTQSAFFMDFGNLTGRQLLLVVKKGQEPKILADPSDDVCDAVFTMPDSTTGDPDDPFRYRFFLGSDFLENFTGKLYVGVRELNASEIDMDLEHGCSSLPRYSNGSDYFTGNFSLRQYVSQCLVIGDNDPDWSTAGCKVGRDTDVDFSVCYCTHLTTFAGGWVVVPNTIDWSYVFANADFLDNPTIYVTQIVIVVLFILAAIYARFKDKELKQKLGIAPLADNDPKDKYFYEIIVCTGMRRNAGTDSQVCFILSGEDDETEVRAFNDSKRKIFRRGQIDGFLMSVPRPLGYLNFMRIWHDNSGKGKFGSWYMNYVIVSDVQTGVKQVFIANKWFAVEEDDGQVDRVIPVAGREQLGDFSYQFGERTRKNLADGHLWFSVVARPPQSRFTCLQRVSCILCLLYVTMLANAMFYNTAQEDEQANNAFAFGPFSVSPEQIFIGVISNLIVFPVNFLLIFLFRKSRPHHKRPSRIDRAIKEVSDSSKQTSINDVKPEVSSIFSVSKTPTLPHDLRDPDASRPCTAMSMTNDKTALQPKKAKKCELPWYFVIIAWILLWIVTLGAALMVTFYGISFKDETCKKWISSLLVSFFMSVFITQPIKVFLFAVILSLIIKNPGEEKEDEEDDEEIHNTHADDALLHEEDNVFGVARPRKIGYKPPDPAVLERHRVRRMKEIKMWAIIREVIIYVFFLWILMVISYRQLGASHFLYKDTMHRVFIANNDTEIDFHKIRNTGEFWTWSKSGLINGLRSGSYYNDYPPLKLRAYVNDKVSRILGYATMRQLRIKPGLCEIPDEMKGIIDQCNVKYEILDQEEGTFRPGWLVMRHNDTLNDTREEYTYSNAKSLNGYPYWGILSWYAGGGYVVPLKGSKEDLIQKMDELQEENWIDKYTRAVFVEFTVYNPQVNLFAIGTILAEFHPSGGMVQSFRFEPAMLLPYMDSAMLFQLVCEVVFLLFTLYFIIHEIRELLRKRLNYFKSFWNLIEIGIISMSVTAIVIFFYRLFLTNDLTKTFKESEGNGYVKFQYVAYWNETFSYMIGMLVFFSTLKFLKLLRFNKKITLLSATLNHSAKSLLHFSIIFGIVFLAFAQLFYLTYMNIDIDYSTFISSVVASVLMMMGKFNIYTMIMAEPILTQIFVLLFVVSVTFVIVNMFVSILNETFTTVREDVRKQGNDYEIVDFMVQSFKKWTGIGGAPKQDENAPNADKKSDDTIVPSAPDYIQDFPDRIDRLLQSISAVYTDNDNFAKMYSKQPFQSGASNPKSFLGMQSQVSSRTPDLDRRRRDSSDVIARVHTH